MNNCTCAALDGSFLEHVEMLEDRSPRDIDVVTFYVLPPGQNLSSFLLKNPTLFQQPTVKTTYHVDGYWVEEHLLRRVLGKA